MSKMKKIIAIILVSCLGIVPFVATAGAAYYVPEVQSVGQNVECNVEYKSSCKYSSEADEQLSLEQVHQEVEDAERLVLNTNQVSKVSKVNRLVKYEQDFESEVTEAPIYVEEKESGAKLVIDYEDNTMTYTQPVRNSQYCVLTIKYVDRETGKALKNEYKEYLHEGDEYEVVSPVFSTHKTEKKVVSGTITEKTTITVYYDSYKNLHATTGTVTVHFYISGQGHEEAFDEPLVIEGDIGSVVHIEVPELDGYSASRGDFSYKITTSESAFYVYYNLISQN